jgi:serine/threonine-protein kinase SRPK3
MDYDHVPVKVLLQTARISRTSHFGPFEQHRVRPQRSLPIIKILDSFAHQGPNGQHQCLVFELPGPTVNQVLQFEHNEIEDKLEPELILASNIRTAFYVGAIKFIHELRRRYGTWRYVT